MTVDLLQQLRALCQALLLGGAMGVVYDLFRILRVRVKLPLLGPLLDLLFWLTAVAALFVWSQGAWGARSGCTALCSAWWEARCIFGPSAPGCCAWATWEPI